MLILTLLACPTPCEGPGCDAVYSATTLALHAGGPGRASRLDQDPMAGDLVVTGSEGQGQDWALVVAPGALLIGLPELAQVRSLSLDEAFDGPLGQQETGLLQGPEGSRFGAALARVPDQDGDGVDELWIGAPDLAPGEALPGAGAALLYLGLGEGFTGEPSQEPALRLAGEAPFDHLGEQVAACDDMDGDELPELVAVAPWDALEAPLSGRVHLLLSTQDLTGEQPVGAVELSWGSQVEGAALGRDLSCAHDLDGDGLAELLVGSPFDDARAEAAGAVHQLTLSPGPVQDQGRIWTGDRSQDYLGWSLATGDMDGDGLPELAAGAPGAGDGDGAVLLFDGARLREGASSPQTRILGLDGERFGSRVELLDLSGDGLAELIVGAPRHEDGDQFAAGALYLFRGAPDATERELSSADASGSFRVGQAFLRTGQGLTLGDTDGDGFPEVLLTLEVEP